MESVALKVVSVVTEEMAPLKKLLTDVPAALSALVVRRLVGIVAKLLFAWQEDQGL
jgi:hypothetical protein